MSDIPALLLLDQQIKQFQALPEPPDSLKFVDVYKAKVEKVLAVGQSEMHKVKTYVEQIDHKLNELRKAIQHTIKQNQDAMQKILECFKPTPFAIPSPEYLEKLKLLRELQEIAKKLINDRLNDLINDTEEACAKCKDGVALTDGDLENLKGCLDSWKKVKEESYKEEQRRKKEEQIRREEEKQRRKEERERKRIEDEERKTREDEERRQREQEEAERKAEEDRKRKQEEERLKQEEEFRQKQEEEDRKKREEEEMRLHDEEERKRRDEEAARKREEHRKRLEDEKKERERLQREAEERAFRQDSNNWKPVVYKRDSSDEVDGRKSYHGGVTCIIASPPGGIVEDDLQCTASDELDPVICNLDDEEKPVSSVIDIKSMHGSLHSEFPSRLYIPHYQAFGNGDEIVVKATLNGTDWETLWPVSSTANMIDYEKTIKRITGIEINDFTTLKAIVVCRPRCQSIIVDKPGVSVYSSMDKNLKIFVPREAYQKKTELRLAVKQVSTESMASYVKDIPSLENILAVNSYVTLSCQTTATKNIELDFLKKSPPKGDMKRGKAYQLYACGDKLWKFADVEYKGHQDELSVSLPTGRHKYTVVEIEVSSSFPKENVLKLADDLYTCINKTRVRMIVKQHEGDTEKCAVRIVRDDQWHDNVQSLTESGFSEGPDTSAPFGINEGQHLQITVTGNMEADQEYNNIVFLSYLGGISVDLTLKVKDTWKQRDLPAYIGNIRCSVLGDIGSVISIVEVTVTIPKIKRQRTIIAYTPVRFPYYLTSLASFVSHNVCKEEDDIWQQILKTLLGEEDFYSGYRLAKRKLKDQNAEQVCKAVLLDWMKSQAAHVDKIVLVKQTLERNLLHNLASSCESFVYFQKEYLTDAMMKEIAAGSTKEVRALGKDLELDNSEIDRCINDHQNNTQDQKLALLMAWRESAHVIKYGNKALEHLKLVCI